MSKKGEVKESKSKLDLALEKIEKDYGKGSVIGASDKSLKVNSISTGSFNLDYQLGVWGFPKGRIIEIYGNESSGKTTICLSTIAEAHKADPLCMCAVIDTEHSLDLGYAQKLGVDLSRLKISQPKTGEEALEIARILIETGEVAVVVIDSVAALVPKSELEGEIGDANVGKHSRLMSQALRILVGTVETNDSILIFTNQMREKIGVIFGDPRTTTGGNALKFYASIRIELSKVTTNKEDDVAVSNKVRAKILKNKVSAPFRNAEFNIVYGEGIDRVDEILNNAINLDIINKNGSWYSYGGTRIGQGESTVLQLINDNPDMYKEIENKVISKLKTNEEDSIQCDENT